ncbi:MAG: hypothetical protein EXS09_17020 [Gemmataceae bacterium]|nr:hypothetical protein [Gemmataceae bacterium]
MREVFFIWDLEDEPDGNVQHVAEHGLTIEEVESVFRDRGSRTETSRSSGFPITFGTTNSGRYIVVVWEQVEKDPLCVRPITAYEPSDDDQP